MAKLIFSKLANEGEKAGSAARLGRTAARWFQRKARAIKLSPAHIWEDRKRRKAFNLKQKMIGNLYYFFYEPLGKDVLPYYDTFPLVLPIELTNDGFLGINFHYLDWRTRGVLMDRLMELQLNGQDRSDLSEQSAAGKLDFRKISYQNLAGLSRYKYFKPALKRYKFTQMRSRLVQLEMHEWKSALFLQVERFEKATPKQVWEESRRKVSERK